MKNILLTLLLLFSFSTAALFAQDAAQKEQAQQQATGREEFHRIAIQTQDEVIKLIRDKYFDASIEKLPWEEIRTKYRPMVEKSRNIEELSRALTAMIGEIKHSHVAIMPPEENSYEFARLYAISRGRPVPAKPVETREDHFARPKDIPNTPPGNIGARFALAENELYIVNIKPGYPAEKNGLRPGDRVVGMAKGNMQIPFQKDVIERYANQPWLAMANMISAGPVGENCVIMYVPRDTPNASAKAAKIGFKEFGIEWTKIGVMDVECGGFDSEMSKDLIGYVSFTPCMPDQIFKTRRAIQALTKQGMKGLIIDVRGNPGGLGSMAGAILGHLVDTRMTMLYTATRRTKMPYEAFPQPNPFLGPVALLIDGGSGSSSEILAAAMKDNKRATVYGTRTAGACLGSQFYETEYGFRLQTVVSKLKRLNGEEIEQIGVPPDVEVIPTAEKARQGIDEVYERAYNDLLKKIK